MSYANVSLNRRSFGETMRRDAWWTQPLFVFLGLSTFLVYSTWAAFQGAHYWLDQNGANYLSPFYSPEIFGSSPHAIFGPVGDWWPSWLIFSPAFDSVGACGFRLTFIIIAVLTTRRFNDLRPCGRRTAPAIWARISSAHLQNIHRYFLYLALLFIHSCHDMEGDVVRRSVWFQTLGIRVGKIVLIATFLLSGYIRLPFAAPFDWRFLDEISKVPVCRRRWRELPESASYALGVDEFILGRLQ
jgi:hypothetical protein